LGISQKKRAQTEGEGLKISKAKEPGFVGYNSKYFVGRVLQTKKKGSPGKLKDQPPEQWKRGD